MKNTNMEIGKNDFPELLTPQDVADRLKISKNSLAVWRCRQQGPTYINVGRRILYPLPDLLVWLEQRKSSQAY